SEDISTSWNVDRDAAVFCACFKRSAILRRIRFILTYIPTTLASPISKFWGTRLTRRSSRFPEKPPSFLGVSTSLGGSGFWGCAFGGGGGGGGGISWGGSGFLSFCFGGGTSCSPLGCEDVSCSLGAGCFDSSLASSFFPADGSPPASSSASSW